MKKTITFLILLGSAGVMQAQTSISDTAITGQTLPGVSVIEGRKKTLKERAEFQRHAQTTEVLTEEELNRNNPAFIEQSLGTMAGVQVDKRTQLGGQRIVIRGYGNDQKFNNWGIKAYYNGIPLTTAEGVTLLDDIDFSVVNNIEVIKGPAATEYGAGVGGVARFYLKTSDVKGVSLTERFNAGSFGLIQSNTRLDVVGDHASQMLHFSHLESDGYRPHGASLKNFLTYMGDFRLSQRQKLSVFFSHNLSFEEVSGQIPYADYYAGVDKGNQAYIRKNARNNFLTSRFGISHQYRITSDLSNYTTFFFSNADYRRVSAGADENSQNPNFGLRSVFAWKKKLGQHILNTLELGTELQQSRSLVSSYRFTGSIDTPLLVQGISGASYFRYVTNQQSGFIHERLNYTPWNLTLFVGLSVNKIGYSRVDLLSPPGLVSGYNRDLAFEKSFEASVNPHIALQKVWRHQIFQISYSEGYNAPTAATAFIGTINKPNDSLMPEKARMVELSAQGLIHHTRFDYQISLFRMMIGDKLTQLSGATGTGATYTYWANTGNQLNQGLEASLGYVWVLQSNPVLSKVEPFVSASCYDFRYTDFKTRLAGALNDYSDKQVVGVPKTRYTMGLDLTSPVGIYLNNTYNYMGAVYTDFANKNEVKSFGLYNSKLGYRHSFGSRLDLDVYVAGNNLTSRINYTFLFLGNSINDEDAHSGFPVGTKTDVSPGPAGAYFFGGFNVRVRL